jgi:hypothetical protein
LRDLNANQARQAESVFMTEQRTQGSRGIREFLNSSAGKAVSIGFILVAIGVIFFSIRGTFGASDIQNFANTRTFICAETLKPYQYELTANSKIPAPSPFSGKNTGYPAEMCYWTKDGKPKKEPTPVLLNTWRKLPEPTFCPDCGRLVVVRNPEARPGGKPPPTEAEFKPGARRANPE